MNALSDSLREARAELAAIERDHAQGMITTDTALALAFAGGIEHARRLLTGPAREDHRRNPVCHVLTTIEAPLLK